MIPVSVVATISLLYLGLLFAVAYYADKKRDAGQSVISNPTVYVLSLAVYHTSWTFYGSVGRAATSGLDFLPVYLGPTLVALCWWYLLRKMVRISKEQNIVSIADLISSRYGKSNFLGALVTIFAVVGIMPYIALQLKAVSHTFDILTLPPAGGLSSLPVPVDTAFIVAVLLGGFAMLFGARHLDASERHEGLVAAVALESLVKLIAFLAVGLFVTYGLFDGFGDIFTRFRTELPGRENLWLLGNGGTSYSMWFSLLVISTMAFMFLPRQFQIMVIENSDEDHIKSAMWRFPAYMFLINLFVIPIALGGLILNGGATSGADYFVLNLPLESGHPWLAMLVFLGGVSASAGMVMVSAVALSTMILTHLIMPAILKFKKETDDISGLLINLKRLGILAVVLLGYLYYRIVGESYALVSIGLVSFMAATQFAPALIGGLFWRRANLRGAAIGLSLGFILWFYTLLVPSFVRSGWFESDILEKGLFGLSSLRPEALFGLTGFDRWSHCLFWTLAFNLGTFLIVSLFTEPNRDEAEQVGKFVDVFAARPAEGHRQRLSGAPTIIEFVELMTKFIGEKQAHAAIAEYVGERPINERGTLSEEELPDLKRFTERTLAGSVGAAPARIIIDNYLAARGSQMEDVFNIFGTVTISRKTSREQLGVLYEAAREVASGGDLQSILDNFLALLVRQFKFDLCVIRILDEKDSSLKVRSQEGMSSTHFGEADREPTMDTFIGATLLENTVHSVNDTDFMDKPASALIIHREGIKSFAHAPITIEGKPVGVISAFSKSAKGIFTEEFIALFKNIAGQVGVALRNAQQTDILIEAKEHEREMQIAKTIQLGLLPLKTPDIPGISLSGVCVPARQVGGDYYDFLFRGEKTLDLVIADVSGHNVGAALIMAETRTFIQARAQNILTPSEIMNALNEFFYEDLSRAELFITMFYLIYDAERGELFYSSAGHNPPVIYRQRSKSFERLDAEGLILGIKRDVHFEEKKALLEPGDILLLYTDGITEAENREGDFFGDQRLCSLLGEYQSLPAEEIIESLLRRVRLFAGNENLSDDVSLVVMKVD